MIPMGRTICLVALLLFTFTARAHARSFRLSQIPNGSRHNCLTCHNTEAGGTDSTQTRSDLNVFGLDIWESFLSPQSSSGIVDWSPELAALDSDGDDATNGEELQDPAGVWESGAIGTAAQVTLPGNVSSTPNEPPVFAPIDLVSGSEGVLISLRVEVTDAEDDVLSLIAADLPEGALFENRTFTWTPDNEQAGEYELSFTASDGTGQVTLLVSLIVENVLIGPEITAVTPGGLTLSGAIDDTVRFTVEAAVPVDAVATYTWTVDGDTTSETGSEYVHTITGEEEVAVIVSDGSETAARSWSIVQGITGDYDGDLRVAFSDFLVFVASFGSREGDTAYEQRFDLNPDGRVDFDDFLIFVSHFGNRV